MNNEQHLPSNEKFGWFFCLIFVISAIYFHYNDRGGLALLFAVLSGTSAAITLVKAALLSPLNKLWFKLGLFLGSIIGPIVIGAIFFTLITPVALVTRWFGRDELKLKPSNSPTYWRERVHPVNRGSFHNQY